MIFEFFKTLLHPIFILLGVYFSGLLIMVGLKVPATNENMMINSIVCAIVGIIFTIWFVG